jgi:hypothetical protein
VLNARGPNCTSACDSILASSLERTTQLITRTLNAFISHLRLCEILQYGNTAAHCASRYGKPDCLKVLIDAKCDPNAANVSRECIRRELASELLLRSCVSVLVHVFSSFFFFFFFLLNFFFYQVYFIFILSSFIIIVSLVFFSSASFSILRKLLSLKSACFISFRQAPPMQRSL